MTVLNTQTGTSVSVMNPDHTSRQIHPWTSLPASLGMFGHFCLFQSHAPLYTGICGNDLPRPKPQGLQLSSLYFFICQSTSPSICNTGSIQQIFAEIDLNIYPPGHNENGVFFKIFFFSFAKGLVWWWCDLHMKMNGK